MTGSGAVVGEDELDNAAPAVELGVDVELVALRGVAGGAEGAGGAGESGLMAAVDEAAVEDELEMARGGAVDETMGVTAEDEAVLTVRGKEEWTREADEEAIPVDEGEEDGGEEAAG